MATESVRGRGGRRGKVRGIVRGNLVDDPRTIPWSREFLELLLLQEGVPLDAVAPSPEIHTVEEPRTDIARVLASVDPAVAGATVTGTITLGTLVAVETGLLSVLPVAVGVSLVLAYVFTREVPDSVTKTHKVQRRGLPEQKLMRYLVMSNELRTMEAEEREKARKRAESRSNQRSAYGGSRRF